MRADYDSDPAASRRPAARRACALLVPAGAALATVASLVPLASTAGAASAPPDGTDPAGASVDLQSPFWPAAAAKCTDVFNDHLERSAESLVTIEVLEAVLGDDKPSPDTIEGWADALAADVERAAAIKADLAGFEVPDPTYADLWDAVVSGYDEAADIDRQRLTALQSGDWTAIEAAFSDTLGAGSSISDASFATLDASPLRATDCLGVYAKRLPANEAIAPEYVTAVSTACVAIFQRRIASGFDDDVTTNLQFLVDVFRADGEDVEVPDDLAVALERLVAEWQATLDDLATVDPALAPDAASWDDVLATATERRDVAAARLDTVASGDIEAIVAAYQPPSYEHPGWDWESAGIDRRICTSLAN